MFNFLPWWTCPLCVLIFSASSGGFCWYQKGKIDQSAMDQYRAQVSLAQAQFEKKYIELKDKQLQITQNSEKKHEANISSVRSYYSKLLQQRSTSSGGEVPSIPSSPGSIDEIPTDALPLAGQCAETTQQLIDLQDWVSNQEEAE